MTLKDIFCIRKDERLLSVMALLVIGFFNYLIISKFYVLFVDYYRAEDWITFTHNFHMSGFDPVTYDVVGNWRIGYSIIRHPLLPFMLYPFYLVNQLLWMITGVNCTQFVVGAILVFCSFYSVIFLTRILRHVVGIGKWDAMWLTFFFFAFAYILVAMIVPDHFCFSLFLILLTLYMGGIKMKSGTLFTLREVLLLLTITAGVTLSNGVIVLIIVVMTNGSHFFRRQLWPSAAVLAVLFGIGYVITVLLDETVGVQVTHWISNDVPMLSVIIENFLGESIQLHRQYMLGDALVRRPVLVEYTWWMQYVVEAVIVLMFAIGAWKGRRSLFMLTGISCFLYAFLLHIVIGFAYVEPYIMAAHWAFVIPIAIAYIYKGVSERWQWAVRIPVILITLYLWTYHTYWLYRYLTWPLRM